MITVSNYDEVTKEEIMDAMNGVFATKETDFMRMCNPEQLCIRDMFDIFNEDYQRYMSDKKINEAAHRFLLESDICGDSFLKLKKLFDNALSKAKTNKDVLIQVKGLSFAVIGRDIFKREIGIVDGHDTSSYFWIMPARVIDNKDIDCIDAVAKMRSIEISIEEDDVSQYLTPFLYKYFDDEFEANKNRVDSIWKDSDGKRHTTYVSGFEWYLTDNFFSFEAMTNILNDINDTIDALSSKESNGFTEKIIPKHSIDSYELLYANELSEEAIKAYNMNKPDNTDIELIIDFYQRFTYRLEYMMRVGKEKGYNLISFMGP